MITLSARELAAAAQCSVARAGVWLGPVNAAMARFEINTSKRAAAFIAQIAHESGRFQFVREIWNPAQCPWQARYEGRLDLGNTEAGDGSRFRGRGLIQITGRANYRSCGAALEQDFEANPALLERPDYAALSAAWFWKSHGCNALADRDEFTNITRRINGGTNGLADRKALWETAKGALA